MASTFLQDLPVDLDDEEDVIIERRIVELVMTLSGCSASRAIALVRNKPTDTTFDRIVYALAATRAELC